jgi:hypothetical protein
VSREDRGGVATVTAAARHLRSRRSTAPTPLRMRKASALRPVAPKRRTTRPLQKRYRSASPVDPPAEAVGPIRSGISARPDVATGAHAPPREHGTTTRPRRKSHHGDGCPEALRSMLHDRGRRERATRTSGRLPGHRRVRSTRAEASAETAHQLPDGCPVSESAEPSPAEASSNPAPTNPGRGARSAPNASPPAAEAEEDVTSSKSRTGCPFSAKRFAARGRSRRRRHIQRIPDGVPGRRHATPSAAETEKDATSMAASGRVPGRHPRSNLRSRSRRGRHANGFRTVPGHHPARPLRPKPKKTSREQVPDVSPIPLPQLAVAANSHSTRRRYRTASRSRTRSRSPEYAHARPPDTSACRAATRDRSGGSASHPAHLEIHFHHAAMRTSASRAAMVSPPRREPLYSDGSSGKSRNRSDRRATVARAEAPGRAAAIRSGRGVARAEAPVAH